MTPENTVRECVSSRVFLAAGGSYPSPDESSSVVARFKEDDKLKTLRFTPDVIAGTVPASGVFLAQKPGHSPVPVSDVIDFTFGTTTSTIKIPVKTNRTFPAGTIVLFALTSTVDPGEGASLTLLPGLAEVGMGTRYPVEAV